MAVQQQQQQQCVCVYSVCVLCVLILEFIIITCNTLAHGTLPQITRPCRYTNVPERWSRERWDPNNPGVISACNVAISVAN